jgi:S-adenosylmethionine/arginine decarboxylase-like enzyme
MRLERCYMAKDKEYAKHLFFVLLDRFNLHIRGVTEHGFYPHGLTILAILAESDAKMHTLPERDVLDLDFSLCGPPIEQTELLEAVYEIFHPGNIKYMVLNRETMCVGAVAYGEYQGRT